MEEASCSKNITRTVVLPVRRSTPWVGDNECWGETLSSVPLQPLTTFLFSGSSAFPSPGSSFDSHSRISRSAISLLFQSSQEHTLQLAPALISDLLTCLHVSLLIHLLRISLLRPRQPFWVSLQLLRFRHSSGD